MSVALYDKIISVVEVYLGPTAQRFIDRQISSHLQKPPHEIKADDLENLTAWIKVSMSLLTDDRSVVEECAQQLAKLT